MRLISQLSLMQIQGEGAMDHTLIGLVEVNFIYDYAQSQPSLAWVGAVFRTGLFFDKRQPILNDDKPEKMETAGVG